MTPNNDPKIDESDVFALFATSIWKVQLAADVLARINRSVRASLEEMNPRLGELEPGGRWQSDHQLHTLDAFRELTSCILHSARTVLGFLKVGDAPIELTGCWANLTSVVQYMRCIPTRTTI